MQANSLRIVLLHAALIAACLIPSLASAQTVVQDNWLGGTGNWDDPSMWSAGVVPNNSSDGAIIYNVTIASGGTDLVLLDSDATIDSLTIGNATGETSTLCSIQLDVCSNGLYESENVTLNIIGNLTVNKKGVMNLTCNYNHYNDTGTFALTVGGSTIIDGKLISKNDSAAVSLGAVTNAGSISVAGSTNLGTSSVTGLSMANSGTVLFNGNSLFSISGVYTQTKGSTTAGGAAGIGAATFEVSGGSVGGSGTIGGGLNLTGGKITPSCSGRRPTYCLNCGDYTQGEKGELLIRGVSTYLYGETVEFNPLTTNSADLSGTLAVTWPADFSGGEFEVLTANSGITGTFTALKLPDGYTGSISYNATSVIVTANPPATGPSK